MRKDNRSVLAIFSGAALALAPALVLAGGDKDKQGSTQQEQQQYEQQSGQAKGTGGGPAAKGEKGEKGEKWGTKTMKLDEKLSFPLVNGCTYAANVKGSVKPLKGKGIGGGPKVSGPSSGEQKSYEKKDEQQKGTQDQQQQKWQEQGSEQQGSQEQQKAEKKQDKQAQAPMLDPDLRIEASVSCPTQATVKVTENLTKTGPMTKDDLENAIERRAAILSEASGRRCLYMPDFALTSEKLNGIGVS